MELNQMFVKQINWKISTVLLVPIIMAASVYLNQKLFASNSTLSHAKSGFSSASIQTLKDDSGWIYAIAITPDGKTLISGGYGGLIKIWDAKTGQLQKTLNAHVDAIESLAISPDGNLIISASWDNEIKLWNPKTGQLINTLKGHSDDIKTIAISPDGKLLASGSTDKKICLWNLSDGKLIKTLDNKDWVKSIAFSPDSQVLAAGGENGNIKIWSLIDEGNYILMQHSGAIQSLAFSPDGQMLASGSADHTVKLWQFKTGKVLHTLNHHSAAVLSVVFNPQGDILASGSYDKTINLWNPNTGELLDNLSEHKNPVWSLAFNPEGTVLASGSGDETIKFWSMNTPNNPIYAASQTRINKVPVIITKPELIQHLNQQLYAIIDQRWQSNLMISDSLIYRVTLNEQGKIMEYQPFNSAAVREMQKTAPIFQPDTQSRSEYAAQFQVVLSADGILEVSPWEGWR
ncbi:MAG: WD40 repeat domain-containing protein [Planktothrix sp. GU0601_MAG3]|nr:MAG: WD40 repeat domain-containing protein [Planktothrix sp. GU0601_MAG3]